MSEEMFLSKTRTIGDFAGVIEDDGDSVYFYLYELNKDNGNRVIGAIFLFSSLKDIPAADVAITWDPIENKVGAFIKGELWAVFNVAERSQFGGGDGKTGHAIIPIAQRFSNRQ